MTIESAPRAAVRGRDATVAQGHGHLPLSLRGADRRAERAGPLAEGLLGPRLTEGTPLGIAFPELTGRPILDVIEHAGGALRDDVAVVVGRALPQDAA